MSHPKDSKSDVDPPKQIQSRREQKEEYKYNLSSYNFDEDAHVPNESQILESFPSCKPFTTQGQTSSGPVDVKREKTRLQAKESRDRKTRYIKELEDKVEFLENKVMRLNQELDEYKNLLKVNDISKDKDTAMETVVKDFKNTRAYIIEQVQSQNFLDNKCVETWNKVIENVGANIGPRGATRLKLIKLGFKVIINHLMPDAFGYVCYLSQFDEIASKRDMAYMK